MPFYQPDRGTQIPRPRTVVSAFGVAWFCLQTPFAVVLIHTGPEQQDVDNPSVRSPSHSAASAPARLAAQNALFKEQYESDLAASPESEPTTRHAGSARQRLDSRPG